MNIDEIAQALSEMNREEIQLLANVLNNNYGISADSYPYPVGIVEPLERIKEDKPTYNVILKSPGLRKLMAVKTVKEMVGIGLREAKQLVDEAPSLLFSGVSLERAEIIKDVFKSIGAIVKVE